MVLIAFRVGLRVDAVRDLLELPHEESESWTYTLRGLNELETTSLLEKFHRETVSSIRTPV